MKKFFIICSLFLFFSCEFGNWDLENLGSNYYMYVKSQGNSYVFYGEKKKGGPNVDEIVIQANVIAVDYDKKFIVAKQDRSRGFTEGYRKFLEKDENLLDSTNYQDFSPLLNEAYWIIIKSEKEYFGPMEYEDYLRKRKELGVPKRTKVKK